MISAGSSLGERVGRAPFQLLARWGYYCQIYSLDDYFPEKHLSETVSFWDCLMKGSCPQGSKTSILQRKSSSRYERIATRNYIDVDRPWTPLENKTKIRNQKMSPRKRMSNKPPNLVAPRSRLATSSYPRTSASNPTGRPYCTPTSVAESPNPH